MDNYQDHIVIVDDSSAMSLIHQKILKKAGYQIIKQVGSVKELMRYLEDSLLVGNPVDLILMDIRMPDEDGIVGCKKVSQNEHFRDIPIIMLTSMNDPEVLEKAFVNGAMDYMIKTAPAVEFKARVNSALSLKRERDNRKAREQELLKLTQSLLAKQTEQQQLTFLDSMTGLYNRKGFEKKLEMEWLNAYTQDHVLSLFMIGVDFFEQYNSEYGREQGDDCLKAIAACLPKVDTHAFSARLGGGEFVLLISSVEDLNSEEILNYGEDIRHSVMALDIPHETSTVEPCVTVSFGVASTSPRACPSSSIFIQAAVEALDQAKTNGGNQVSFVQTADPEEGLSE